MSRNTPGKQGRMLDIFHVVTGILITITAVLAFTNPVKNEVLFPVIFFLGAILNLVTGRMYLKMYPRQKKKKNAAIGYLAAGALMLLLGVVSAVSIWG